MGHSESLTPITQGVASSPIVEQSWKKRVLWKEARSSCSVVSRNVMAMLLLYCEMSYSVIANALKIKHSSLWYMEFTLLMIFVLNILYSMTKYLSNYMFSAQLEVSQIQKHLLGVKDNDSGFVLSPVKPLTEPKEHSLVFASTPSNQAAYSPSNSPRSSLCHVTPASLGSFSISQYSQKNYSSLGNSFLSTSGYQPYDQSSSYLLGNTTKHSFNTSMSQPYSPGTFSGFDGSGFHSRFNFSTSYRSPSPSDKMTDLQSLSMYLKEQEEEERKAFLGSQDLSLSSSSFWNYGKPSLDYSYILRKNNYQLASKSPQSHKSRSDDNESMGEEVWRPLGVTEDDLFLWIERLRKWIGNTILMNLSHEIDSINSQLRKIGCEDTEIGAAGVATLKQLTLTKASYIPSLNVMVPYLEMSSNQEYLVKRIKELGSDGCIGEYSWSSGSQFGSKPWGEHLPTDAQIVCHMFCTYMDSRLPPDLTCPDMKTFTSQHFLKMPATPHLDKGNIQLYQSSVNPPHFQVVIKDKIYNLPKGRNNLFHAILFFLHHIKHKENGMLGQVSLAMSGVNILCVLDD